MQRERSQEVLMNLRERYDCGFGRRLLLTLPPVRLRRGHSKSARGHLDGGANSRLFVILFGLLVNLGDTRAPEQVEKRGAFVLGLGDAEPDEAPADEERSEQFDVCDVGDC